MRRLHTRRSSTLRFEGVSTYEPIFEDHFRVRGCDAGPHAAAPHRGGDVQEEFDHDEEEIDHGGEEAGRGGRGCRYGGREEREFPGPAATGKSAGCGGEE